MQRKRIYAAEPTIIQWREILRQHRTRDRLEFWAAIVLIGVTVAAAFIVPRFESPEDGQDLQLTLLICAMLLCLMGIIWSAARWAQVRRQLFNLLPDSYQRDGINPLEVYVSGTNPPLLNPKYVLIESERNPAAW